MGNVGGSIFGPKMTPAKRSVFEKYHWYWWERLYSALGLCDWWYKQTQWPNYRSDENESELYDVCVGHRVEASQQGVGDGHSSRDPDAHGVGQIQDHTHGYSYETHMQLPCTLKIYKQYMCTQKDTFKQICLHFIISSIV